MMIYARLFTKKACLLDSDKHKIIDNSLRILMNMKPIEFNGKNTKQFKDDQFQLDEKMNGFSKLRKAIVEPGYVSLEKILKDESEIKENELDTLLNELSDLTEESKIKQVVKH